MPASKPFIVKIEEHHGGLGAVSISNYEAGTEGGHMYAIGTMQQGVIELDDYFYWTLESAKEAIGG